MSEEPSAQEQTADFGERIVYWLALVLVIIGLLNSMPGIPGVDDAFAEQRKPTGPVSLLDVFYWKCTNDVCIIRTDVLLSHCRHVRNRYRF